MESKLIKEFYVQQRAEQKRKAALKKLAAVTLGVICLIMIIL